MAYYDRRPKNRYQVAEESARMGTTERPSAVRGAPAMTTSRAPSQGVQQALAPKGSGAQTGTSWVNLQDYLGMNKSQGQQMATQMAGGVAAAGQKVQQGIAGLEGQRATQQASDWSGGKAAPTYGSLGAMGGYGELAREAETVSQRAKGLTTFGGRQLEAQKAFGQQAPGGYSAGQSRWDAWLAGAAGGKQLGETAGQYGGLDKALGLADERAAEEASKFSQRPVEAPAPIVLDAARQALNPQADRTPDSEKVKNLDDTQMWSMYAPQGMTYPDWVAAGRPGMP